MVHGLLSQLCAYLDPRLQPVGILAFLKVSCPAAHPPNQTKIRWAKDGNLEKIMTSSEDKQKRRTLTIRKSSPGAWWEVICCVKNHTVFLQHRAVRHLLSNNVLCTAVHSACFTGCLEVSSGSAVDTGHEELQRLEEQGSASNVTPGSAHC